MPTIKDDALFYGAEYKSIITTKAMVWCNVSTISDPSICDVILDSVKYYNVITCKLGNSYLKYINKLLFVNIIEQK